MSGKWQKTGLQIARCLISEGDDGQVGVKGWHDACAVAGMVRQTQHRVLQTLLARGEMVLDGELLRLPNS